MLNLSPDDIQVLPVDERALLVLEDLVVATEAGQ